MAALPLYPDIAALPLYPEATQVTASHALISTTVSDVQLHHLGASFNTVELCVLPVC